MTTNKDNEQIQQSEAQADCYRALASDFKVGAPVQKSPVPGHGQRGNSKAEEAKLFSERPGTFALTEDDLATATDKAGPPRIARAK
jgi:hypothetical protein